MEIRDLTGGMFAAPMLRARRGDALSCVDSRYGFVGSIAGATGPSLVPAYLCLMWLAYCQQGRGLAMVFGFDAQIRCLELLEFNHQPA